MGGDVISPYGKPAQDKGTLDDGIQRYNMHNLKTAV